MTLLWPMAAWFLLALAVPVLLHVRRRLQQQHTLFAALRWLQSQQKPRHRLRIDELVLLLLRLLLLAALVLLLMRPAWREDGDTTPVLALWPGVKPPAGETTAGLRTIWLLPGFPEHSDAPASTEYTDPYSLLRELDARLPPGTPLQVRVPAQLRSATGTRPALSRPVEWSVAADAARAEPAAAPTVQPRPQVPDRIELYLDDASQDALPVWRALQQAWQDEVAGTKPQLQLMPASEPAPAVLPAGVLRVWLRAADPPQHWRSWLVAGGVLLLDRRAGLAWADAPPARVILRDGEGRPELNRARFGAGWVLQAQRDWQWADWPLLAEAVFPALLLEALDARVQPSRTEISIAAELAPRHDPTLPARAPDQPWQDGLAVLLAFLFALERAWASRRTWSVH